MGLVVLCATHDKTNDEIRPVFEAASIEDAKMTFFQQTGHGGRSPIPSDVSLNAIELIHIANMCEETNIIFRIRPRCIAHGTELKDISAARLASSFLST